LTAAAGDSIAVVKKRVLAAGPVLCDVVRYRDAAFRGLYVLVCWTERLPFADLNLAYVVLGFPSAYLASLSTLYLLLNSAAGTNFCGDAFGVNNAAFALSSAGEDVSALLTVCHWCVSPYWLCF
jgi:hypothetical protein